MIFDFLYDWEWGTIAALMAQRKPWWVWTLIYPAPLLLLLLVMLWLRATP